MPGGYGRHTAERPATDASARTLGGEAPGPEEGRGAPAADTVGTVAADGDDAQLALQKVRVDGRPANLYVFDDRIVIATEAGDRVIPMDRLERIATRRSWRGARLLLALSDDEVLQVRGLSASSTSLAHRTIVGIARSRH
jgi:hypothetical protein